MDRARLAAAAVGIVAVGVIAAGVLWSNYLQYRNVTLAPHARMAELATIGTKLDGKGPTFVNEYEIYADRHFLRAGAPVEPAEYRQVNLPVFTNAILTKQAWADIDSFALPTLMPYRSLVIRASPVESRPPSIYRLAWSGTYYQLWQQPVHPTRRVISHLPLGDSNSDAYCGDAERGAPFSPICSIQPAAVPACPQVVSLAASARAAGGSLLAYERPNPIVLRATDTQWPASWIEDAPARSLIPTTPGTAVAHLTIPTGPHRYRLWLGGAFNRGFRVTVDGRAIGSIADQLNPIGAYDAVGASFVLGSGLHTLRVTYPKASLAPGNTDAEQYTGLNAIALQPLDAPARMLHVSPADARRALCGKTLDWIEVVAPARG